MAIKCSHPNLIEVIEPAIISTVPNYFMNNVGVIIYEIGPCRGYVREVYRFLPAYICPKKSAWKGEWEAYRHLYPDSPSKQFSIASIRGIFNLRSGQNTIPCVLRIVSVRCPMLEYLKCFGRSHGSSVDHHLDR